MNMKSSMGDAPRAFVLSALTTLMVAISMVDNWLAHYQRADLMQHVADSWEKVES